MHLDSLVADLALILIVAGIVTLIFRRLKQPVVLGYIVAGFLISPNFHYIPTVVESGDIGVWADIGIIFLMFGLGLEFSFLKIATVGGSAFTIAITVMTAMLFIGTGVGHLMGWEKMDCIFLGGMLSMSSTMIILKAFEEYHMKEKDFAQMVLGALVIEDIAGIFMLVILSTLSVSRDVTGTDLAGQLAMPLVYLAIWLLLGIYIIPSVLKRVANLLTDELLVVLALGICFLMVVIANAIGFSSALGAFVAGSILAGTVRGERIEGLVKPIRDLFGAIFFVSVGMMIQPELLGKYIVPILILTLVTIAGQKAFATLGMLLSGQPLRTAVQGGSAMVQIGEFSFIVATLGMSLGVISDFLYPIIVCVSVITAFLTPLFIRTAPREAAFWEKHLPRRLQAFLKRNTSPDQSRYSRDEDWYAFTRKVAVRTLVCSLFMFVIYYMGKEYLGDFVDNYVSSPLGAKAITAGIMILVMVPFINFMHGVDSGLYVKLWTKHRANHLPLITLKAVRVLIAACFIALVLRQVFRIPFPLLVLIAAIPIVLIIRSEWITGVTIDMEMRFIANFSEKTLARQKKERGLKGQAHWLNESLIVAEFRVTDTDERDTIFDFADNPSFRVTIIRIIREGRVINMPTKDERVLAGDLLHMMGTQDEIDACTMLLEEDQCIEYTDRRDVRLKEYIYGQSFYHVPEADQLSCLPLKVEGSMDFVRKSIKNSGIRPRFKATIIGIERGDLPIINPDIETVLRKDDLLWLMGGKNMVDRLIEEDLLQSR